MANKSQGYTHPLTNHLLKTKERVSDPIFLPCSWKVSDTQVNSLQQPN